MNVAGISTYQNVVFGNHTVKPQIVEKQGQAVVEAAKAELEAIEKQGKVAGTDAAWWRPGFSEAKEALENIVKTGESNQPEYNSYKSSLMSFHDYDDDGLI